MRESNPILFPLVACLVAWLAFPAPGFAAAEEPPNIVFILVDDLGVECLSSYGGTSHKTPNIDKLASQGMQFSSCFSDPFCSPSRANLLTGRYPFKNGLKEVLYSFEKHADTYLHTDQPSFARQLKQAGYATVLSGKWHLSLLNKHNTINAFGFDQYQSWQIFKDDGSRTTRFYSPYINRNGVIIADEVKERYGPDVNVEFLIDSMRASVGKKQPFLAYYTDPLPHFPWEPTPDSVDQSYKLPNPDHKGDPKYFPDMVTYMDKNVGRIMKSLDELGIADNTVVIFLADNGTDRDLESQWGEGKTIRGGKGTMTDRGTHVPLIVRWPGKIKAGSVCGDLIDFSDFFPTLCELAKAPLPEAEIHGRSFVPQLLGKQGNPREWVHVQDKEKRHLRSDSYILDNRNRLRPVVEIWQPEAKPLEEIGTPEEKAAYRELKAVFGKLGK